MATFYMGRADLVRLLRPHTDALILGPDSTDHLPWIESLSAPVRAAVVRIACELGRLAAE